MSAAPPLAQLLRARRWAEALEQIEALLHAGPPPGDLLARLHSLRVQALLALDRDEEAAEALRAARPVLARQPDPEARRALDALARRVSARRLAAEAAAHRRAEVLARPPEPWTPGAGGEARAQRVLERVEALVAAGRLEEADALARPLAEDGHAPLRERVMAALALARARPGEAAAWVRRAHALADARDEAGLVAAVARVAEELGVDRPTWVFG